jgi:hypothetical protein
MGGLGFSFTTDKEKMILRVIQWCVLIFAIMENAMGEVRDTQKEGVVLLHGLSRTAGSMEKMRLHLEQRGYVVLNQGYASRSGSVSDLAARIMGKVHESEALAACEVVHFVTHSLGGILLRSYFEEHNYNKLGRVVMLGPPNQGSEVVDKMKGYGVFRWITGEAGGQLGTEEQSEPNQLGPIPFELGVIAGDRSINWINSMMIDGDDDGKVSIERTKVEGMKQHIVVHASHPFLMKKREVMEQTAHFLEHGRFSE